ncbi:hypothetical protein MVEG_00244 [Podila verticillata NRRL 6337]|nr:hypothetical protein MVEG_00244 [Podila verticillata NRRL 6337]
MSRFMAGVLVVVVRIIQDLVLLGLGPGLHQLTLLAYITLTFTTIPPVSQQQQANSTVPQFLFQSQPPQSTNLMKRACYFNGCRCNPSLGGLACHSDDVCKSESNGECCISGYRQQCRDCGRPNSKIL